MNQVQGGRNVYLHFKVVRFITESAMKLHMTSVPLATACLLYHKFFRDCKTDDYDPYLIATTCLYLAGKIEEEHVKLRDVINVCHRTLHPSKPALDIGDDYWAFRDSVANCELFIMRVMKFRVSFNHPHKYLLHYISTLSNWIDVDRNTPPFVHLAWSFLRDSYQTNVCLNYKPQHLAIAVLFLALESHGIEVPYTDEAQTKWWQVFSDDITLDTIKRIMIDIMDTYQIENTVQR